MSIVFLKSSELQLPEFELPLMNEDCLFVMPSLNTDQAHRAATLMQSRAGRGLDILCVEDDLRLGFIPIVNQAFTASSSTYFGYCAEDAFAGRHWLKKACSTIETQKKGLLGFNDGKWHGLLASFGLALRRWAVLNYGGAFFHPQYRSHYADTELTLLAIQQKMYCYDPNAVLVEVDWLKDGKPNNPLDKALFSQRKKSGFDAKVSDTRLLGLFG